MSEVQSGRWMLISREVVAGIREDLIGFHMNGTLHDLDTGLHSTDATPDDYRVEVDSVYKKPNDLNAFNEIFAKLFYLYSLEVHETAVSKGWWNDENGDRADRNDGEIFSNFHAEISEAWESFRCGNPDSEKIQGFSQIEEELADCIIRIMDYAVARDFDVAAAILAKMEYNKSREYRHGGKKA